MAVIENSVLIKRPIEVVFESLIDIRNELKWNPRVVLMEKLTDGPVGLGTKFKAKWKTSPVVTVECMQCERPTSWTHHNGGPIEVTLSARLEPHPEGTTLYARFEATPHGWFTLIFPLFLISIRKEEKRNMQYIKAWLESV